MAKNITTIHQRNQDGNNSSLVQAVIHMPPTVGMAAAEDEGTPSRQKEPTMIAQPLIAACVSPEQPILDKSHNQVIYRSWQCGVSIFFTSF
mmetsp:Transcript_13222/g.28678  ORF Transcript_13222/g.28678 Transcript_13222/m.28678 type:complete len:91 (+) Transcript_13222:1189-1461(+)